MFKNPFSFKGRIRRAEYGISMIIYIAVLLTIQYILIEIRSLELFYFILIPMYWFMLAQAAKRCHDRGNSAWYIFIPFYSLWLLFGVGDFGENDYGPDPKNSTSSSEVEIDAFALNNYVETKDSKVVPVSNNEKLTADIYQLNSYIKEERRSIFGSNKREPILNLINSLCGNKEEALLLLDSYTSMFNSDLIADLSKINKSYDAIKENVQAFIALEVVKPEYPHERI